MLDKVKDYLPVIGLAAIFISYYDIYNLYQRFGVEIYYYLEPTEIIFSFSSFYSTLIFIAVSLMAVNIPNEFLPFYDVKNDEQQKEESLIESYRRFRLGALLIISIGLIATVTVIVLGINQFEKTGLIEELEIVYFFLLLYGFVVFIYRLGVLRKEFQSKIKGVELRKISGFFFSGNVYVLLLLIVMFFLINMRNLIKHKNIISGNPKYSMELKMDGRYVSSSSSFYYIGSTKNYALFYDSIVKDVKVIPERDIKQSSIKKLRSGL